MAFWNRKDNKEDNSDTIQSVRDLSEEDRADIEAMLDDGEMPSAVAVEFAVPLRIIQSIRRMQTRKPAAETPRPAAPARDDPVAKEREQLEVLRIQMERESLMADAALAREERKLDIDLKREELRQIRYDMMNPPDGGGDKAEEIMMHFDDNPIGSLLWFLRDLKKTSQNAPQSPQTQQGYDVTKPLAKEQIKAVMASVSPSQIQETKKYPDAMIAQGLKQRYPGITEQNINSIIEEIRHYGEQSSIHTSTTVQPSTDIQPSSASSETDPLHSSSASKRKHNKKL